MGYWVIHYHVFNISSGINEIGSVQWNIYGYYLLSLIVAFLCVYKGIQKSGDIIIVTALLPYFLLLALFIRGLFLGINITITKLQRGFIRWS